MSRVYTSRQSVFQTKGRGRGRAGNTLTKSNNPGAMQDPNSFGGPRPNPGGHMDPAEEVGQSPGGAQGRIQR